MIPDFATDFLTFALSLSLAILTAVAGLRWCVGSPKAVRPQYRAKTWDFLSVNVAITAAGITSALAFVTGACPSDRFRASEHRSELRIEISFFEDDFEALIPPADGVPISVRSTGRNLRPGRCPECRRVELGSITRNTLVVWWWMWASLWQHAQVHSLRSHATRDGRTPNLCAFQRIWRDALDFDVRILLRDVTKSLWFGQINHQITESFKLKASKYLCQRDIWLRNRPAGDACTAPSMTRGAHRDRDCLSALS
ncbi:hypothetical protein [Marivita cryptomonadis]|uniref:hypothetical protein n=1 Tax=Marivita cryptomonadis TaxID=505252 RepID=UPI003919403D